MAETKVTSNEISSIPVKRNNNGTNITEVSNIQSGWAAGQPGVANTANLTVTFPTAFVNVPVVTAVFGGDTATTTATLGSGAANINNAYAEAVSITTTGCIIRVVSGGGSNWAAGNTVYAQWIAVGA